MRVDFTLIDVETGTRLAGEAAVSSSSTASKRDGGPLVHLSLREPAVGLLVTSQGGATTTTVAVLGQGKDWTIGIHGPTPERLLVMAVA